MVTPVGTRVDWGSPAPPGKDADPQESPTDTDELFAVAEAIARYWFATVTLP